MVTLWSHTWGHCVSLKYGNYCSAWGDFPYAIGNKHLIWQTPSLEILTVKDILGYYEHVLQ